LPRERHDTAGRGLLPRQRVQVDVGRQNERDLVAQLRPVDATLLGVLVDRLLLLKGGLHLLEDLKSSSRRRPTFRSGRRSTRTPSRVASTGRSCATRSRSFCRPTSTWTRWRGRSPRPAVSCRSQGRPCT